MDVDASDAGDPRLILNSHRALDAIGGFVPPTDIRVLRVVSKTASDSRVLVATRRVVTQRWTVCAASKRARRRLEAVDAMGRFLGPDAEGFLTAIFRDDKLQTVRAAAATWLARVARCASPATKQRIFAAACERYDAETQRGCMNVRQAIERSFPDVYGAVMDVDAMSVKELKALIGRAGLSCVDCVEKSDLRARARQAVARDNSVEYARMHLAGGAGGRGLAEFVAATLAAREDQLRRQCEAPSVAAAGVMGGKIHLFREDADGLRRVHFKLDRGRDDSVKLAFANPLERSVLLQRYESRGLCGDQGLSVVEIPPRSVRHFVTIELYRGTAFSQEPTSTASLPEGRWMLRMPPMVLDEGNQGRWISGGSGLLRLEARLRARSDGRGAEHCRSELPFELWTFELATGALTCRVDPVSHVRNSDRTPYQPQSPPPPPPLRWRQSLSDEFYRSLIPPLGPGSRPIDPVRPRYTHSEWLHRYPDPVQLLPAAGPINLDVEARPGHPRQFQFSDEAEPRACEIFNSWPGTVAPVAPAAAVGCAWCGRADDITEVGGLRLCGSCRRQSGQ